ncbi:alpha/beta hydrolase family esterase [Maribacter sp. 2307ULW6-5]|uniref:alpha/beta hydrolase family esterase n=1 Tax=Maribacter sp. 2307ULW6-5 TaxID=3386275 RepID=UPI0039BCA9ED
MMAKANTWYLCLVLLALCAGCNTEDDDAPGGVPEKEFYASIMVNGQERTYFVHLPEGYGEDREYPLLFMMHGGGRLGYEGVAAQSQMSQLSDREKFILVYPEGVETLGFRTWNAGNCCPGATLLNTDDVGFIMDLLDTLEQTLGVDGKRVYAAGFSNGGQMAYRLANEHPDRFAAVGAVAGVLQDFPFEPERNVPIIHFHSYQDTTAPYNGGPSDAPNIDLIFPSVEETMAIMADHYNCPDPVELVFSAQDGYDHFRYGPCDGGAEIEWYVSRDGGHSWPGGQSLPSVEMSTQFSASDLMWSFFERHQLP